MPPCALVYSTKTAGTGLENEVPHEFLSCKVGFFFQQTIVQVFHQSKSTTKPKRQGGAQNRRVVVTIRVIHMHIIYIDRGGIFRRDAFAAPNVGERKADDDSFLSGLRDLLLFLFIHTLANAWRSLLHFTIARHFYQLHLQ